MSGVEDQYTIASHTEATTLTEKDQLVQGAEEDTDGVEQRAGRSS